MKKIISTVAAFGLIAGFAATASAVDVPDHPKALGLEQPAKPTAPDVGVFSFTGSYSLGGVYLSDGNGSGQDRVATTSGVGEEEAGDAWWFHSFVIKTATKVGDKLQLKAEFRIADRYVFGDSDIASQSNANGNSNSGHDVDANRAWMEYMSPIGKLSMGRMASGAWYSDFMNSSARANRIILDPSFLPKPFFAKFLMEKQDENDYLRLTGSGTPPGNGIADQDTELYLLHVGAKMDWGTSVLGWFHRRIASLPQDGDDVIQRERINFYGKYKFQNFGLEMEIAKDFGDWTVGAGNERDLDALGYMFDLTAGFGKLNAGLLYFYMSGEGDGTGDHEGIYGASGVGNDYNPFIILTGDWMGLLNADKGAISSATVNTAGGLTKTSGVSAFGLHASYAVSPKLSVSGIIGMASSDEEIYANQDDDMGFEVDLGVSYKLLANLTYGAHFGYLDAGDFWQKGDTTLETNGVYLLAHQLVMKF